MWIAKGSCLILSHVPGEDITSSEVHCRNGREALQFPQNQLENRLTPSAPLEKLNISVSLGVVQNKCCTAYGALPSWMQKWSRFSSSQVAHAQVSPAEKLSAKTVAQGIQLCQEGEETLEGSLVPCSGSSSSSRKRRVYYTGLLCSLAHACKESQQDFCYQIPWEHLKFLPDVVC